MRSVSEGRKGLGVASRVRFADELAGRWID